MNFANLNDDQPVANRYTVVFAKPDCMLSRRNASWRIGRIECSDLSLIHFQVIRERRTLDPTDVPALALMPVWAKEPLW
jgi:hypothetical protein